MRAVIQRVNHASVTVDGAVIGHIEKGLLVLVGVAKGDTEQDVTYLVEKLLSLRIFSDEQGKMNRSLEEAQGALLVVSQFTLLGDVHKGRRPGFDGAAASEQAKSLYDLTVDILRARAVPVETGQFGAMMTVGLENDGPVTFILDSRQ